MLKQMKPGHQYMIINCDEPYAKEVYEVLKRGQMAKDEWPEGDISFEEWYEQTFSVKVMIPNLEMACEAMRALYEHDPEYFNPEWHRAFNAFRRAIAGESAHGAS